MSNHVFSLRKTKNNCWCKFFFSYYFFNLFFLKLQKRTVHTVYILQPKKKDLEKLMLKLLAPSKDYSASFKVSISNCYAQTLFRFNLSEQF